VEDSPLQVYATSRLGSLDVTLADLFSNKPMNDISDGVRGH
jgi:hypothetical protein